jgi:hypothetical protein
MIEILMLPTGFSSNSPNNDTQTKSTTVCHKQGISTTKINWLIWFLVYNATFSNISAISWRPVLVVEEDGVT